MQFPAKISARTLAIAFGLAILTWTTGCQKPPSSVAGKVSFDGQPLANGSIQFVPADGASASAGAEIKDGAYAVELPAGKKIVRISAMKVVGKRVVYQGDPKSPVVDDVREMIPRQYNAASTLTATVAAGQNEQNFDLKTAP